MKKDGCGFIKKQNRSSRQVDEALIMKLAWGFLTNSHDVWSNTVRSKYGDSQHVLVNHERRTGSSTWRGVNKVPQYIYDGTGWCVGNGNSVEFWMHTWTQLNVPLFKLATSQIPLEDQYRKVYEYVDHNGQWDCPKFQHLLPASALACIASINPLHVNHGDDVPYWLHSSSGKFTVKSAFVRNSCHAWSEKNDK